MKHFVSWQQGAGAFEQSAPFAGSFVCFAEDSHLARERSVCPVGCSGEQTLTWPGRLAAKLALSNGALERRLRAAVARVDRQSVQFALPVLVRLLGAPIPPGPSVHIRRLCDGGTTCSCAPAAAVAAASRSFCAVCVPDSDSNPDSYARPAACPAPLLGLTITISITSQHDGKFATRFASNGRLRSLFSRRMSPS